MNFEKYMDVIKEINVRVKNGNTLEQAKQNTIWLEDLTNEDREYLNILFDNVQDIFGVNEVRMLEICEQAFKAGLLEEGEEYC